VALDWAANRFYFPFVYQLGPGSWGAWVYDHSAATWVPIGVLELPGAWGKLAPASVTALPWVGKAAAECARYPVADALFLAPYGYVGSTGSIARPRTTAKGAGDCPPTSSTEGLWARYRVGAG